MTGLPQRRRTDRLPGRGRLALAGDFPDDDRDITQVIGRPADWDGTTWEDASGAARPGGGVFYGASPEPAGFQPDAARHQPAAPQHDPRDTAPQQRLPRMNRLAQRPRPRREPDLAIFTWSNIIHQHIMLCFTCPPERRSRHADPIAATMPLPFESLRQSAYVMGWRLDTYGRWACKACQDTTRYNSPRQVIQYDPGAAEAYQAGDTRAEYWHRAAAELDLILDVTSAGKHQAGTP